MQEQTSNQSPRPKEESQDDHQEDEEDSTGGINGLYQLCLEGNLDLVKEEIAQVDHIDETDEDDYTYLHYAIQGGNVQVARFLIEEQGAQFEGTETEEDRSALAKAIENGHLEMIQYLVDEHDADMNAPLNEDDMTPLHHTCVMCHFDIVKYFVEDIQVNLFDSDDDHWTAMHYACLGGSHQNSDCLPEIADYLRRYYTPLVSQHLKFDSQLSALEEAAAERLLGLVEETEIGEVSHCILEYLSSADIRV